MFECGLLRGSYIPPQALKDLRDLTRYRVKTVQARTSEIQRLAGALEPAGIKLDSVVSDLTGKSAGLMTGALTGGERRGRVLAGPAIGRMRTAGKLADLSQALAGRFTDHHAVLCRLHLDRIALPGTAVAGLEQKIAVKVTPYQRELDLLKSITGFGGAVAQAWLAGIGPAPHEYCASHEKLASWVTLCPGNHMSAGKRRHGRTGDAGTYIKPMLVQAAWSAIKSQGRLQARYHKLVRRFGGPENPAAVKKAILAVAHTLLKIACQVLRSGKPYADLGADFKNRGVRDVCMLVCDGLKGLPDAVNTVWEKTIVQTCIVHLLRNSFKYASRRDWAQIAKDLKPVYTAASEAEALDLFAGFSGKWEKRYPAIIRLWENAWAEFVPFLQFDREIRTVICTTNAIESINARLRRAVNARGHFPTEQAALKCLYMAIMSLDPTGKGRNRWTNRWKAALNAFDITFDGRLSAGRK